MHWAGDWLLLLWLGFIFWRATAVALMPREPHFWLRSLAGAALLFVGVPLAYWAYQPWFYAAPPAPQAVAQSANPASEEVLIKQPQLLYEAVSDLEDERPGVTDLYFVGFASYAAEDVFRKDIEVARDLFDSRFDTDGRSIALINNPQTMLDVPFATVSNLRATLSEIGDIIDPEQDVVMIYLTSHGSRDHKLSVEFAPLQLDPLTPEVLKEMLDSAGIKWRIIVVSACYSGGFIDPLKDEYTLIMTASAADRLDRLFPGDGAESSSRNSSVTGRTRPARSTKPSRTPSPARMARSRSRRMTATRRLRSWPRVRSRSTARFTSASDNTSTRAGVAPLRPSSTPAATQARTVGWDSPST